MEPTENTPRHDQERESQPTEKIGVETKLIFATENGVVDPHSPLYAALPPIFQPTKTEKPLTAAATT